MVTMRYHRPPTKVVHSPTSLPPEAIPAWIHPRGRAYLQQRGITKEESIRYDLHFCDGGLWSQRIIIPMHKVELEHAGFVEEELTAFQGRDVTGDDLTRYKTEGPRPLYLPLWPPFHAGDPLIIVEGPFDAYAVLRDFPAVALLGIFPSTAQLEQLHAVVKYFGFEAMYIWFDTTATGEACALQMKLLPHVRTYVIVDERHKDPGEYLCHDATDSAGAVIRQHRLLLETAAHS